MNSILIKYKTSIAFLLIISILNLSFGCSYIKVSAFENMDSELSISKIKELENLKKYFVIHTQNDSYHFNIIKLDDNNSMEIELIPLAIDHSKYSNPVKESYRYKKLKEKQILEEVHFYMNDKVQKSKNNRATIKLSTISRMDIIKPDHARTNASYIFGAIGITTVMMVVVVIGSFFLGAPTD